MPKPCYRFSCFARQLLRMDVIPQVVWDLLFTVLGLGMPPAAPLPIPGPS
jgi:hypothetical protein